MAHQSQASDTDAAPKRQGRGSVSNLERGGIPAGCEPIAGMKRGWYYRSSDRMILHRQNPEDAPLPIGVVPQVTGQIVHLTDDGQDIRTEYLVVGKRQKRPRILTEDELDRGTWAAKTGNRRPTGNDERHAFARKIREEGDKAPEIAARTYYNDAGDLVLPDADAQTLGYHAQLGLVETTDITTGMKTARRLLRLNGGRRHPCQHVAIDSDCRGTGKRTLLHHIGLAHQGRREKLHGIDDSRIPVVCVNAPPEPGAPADWSATLAVFIGWDLYRPDTEQRPVQRMKDFTGPAVHVMRHARTEICLVDGIDRLRSEDLQPTFDFFDYLADELDLTVFWSGIGSSDILREARAARFPALRRPTEATAPIRPRAVPTLWVNRLPPRCKEHPDEWVSTLANLDGRLRLRHHKPGSLLEHQKDIYRITDGLMEHLTPLIGMAAQLAILDRTEAITRDVLHDAARYLDLPSEDGSEKAW